MAPLISDDAFRAAFAEASQSREHLALAAKAPRCVHLKADGVRCGSPAMRRLAHCFFHDRFYNAPGEDTFPPLEDPNAIQVSLMRVIERLRSEVFRRETLDLRAVNSLFYGLQTAAFNSQHTTFDRPVLRDEYVTADPLSVAHAADAEGGPAPPPSPVAAKRGQDKKAPRSETAPDDVERGNSGPGD